MGRAKEEVCDACKGSGEERSISYGRYRPCFLWKPCVWCGGTGRKLHLTSEQRKKVVFFNAWRALKQWRQFEER
jgi:DnaJ-class molecular chaperone